MEDIEDVYRGYTNQNERLIEDKYPLGLPELLTIAQRGIVLECV